jgi:hypothetical protein
MHGDVDFLLTISVENGVNLNRLPKISSHRNSSRQSVVCLLYRRSLEGGTKLREPLRFAACFGLSTSSLLTNPLFSVVTLCGCTCKGDSIPVRVFVVMNIVGNNRSFCSSCNRSVPWRVR